MQAPKPLLSYTEIVRELEARGIMPDAPPSLEPMKKALERLLPLAFNPRTVIVAGTNGKGTVCASLEALFLAAGESVGLYTSPHLQETTERIRLNGKDIDQELFCHAYRRVVEKTEGIPLSHFDVLTLMAAWVFYSGECVAPVDRPIFEVGLGDSGIRQTQSRTSSVSSPRLAMTIRIFWGTPWKKSQQINLELSALKPQSCTLLFQTKSRLWREKPRNSLKVVGFPVSRLT